MKEYNEISRFTIDRLPVYFRELRILYREGQEIISSEKLGLRVGVNPVQIRKDLADFGEFGKKGLGYDIKDLIHNISKILGLYKELNIAIIGAGHLGRALACNKKIASMAFNLMAIFDVDDAKIGKSVNGIKINDINQINTIIKERNIDIAVITTPESVAQKVTDMAIKAGIQGVWNFAPVNLRVSDDIYLVNEDLSVGLASLYYYISKAWAASGKLAVSGK